MESETTNKKAPVEEGKLLKASKVALTGMGIAILSGVFANVVNYFLSGEANRIMEKQGTLSGGWGTEIIGLTIQVAILVGFCWLAFSLRKSKSRAIAVNLIVFSSIFIVFDIFSVAIIFIGTGALGMIYESAEVEVLRQSMYLSQAVLGLAIVAWSIVFAGGIIGVRAPESELEENRLG